jgi:hypothetical protein
MRSYSFARPRRTISVGVRPRKIHLVDLVRGRFEYPELVAAALMGVAASFIARLLQNHRWIAYVGLAVILYVALEMIYRGAHELRPVVNAVAGL